MGRGEGTGPQWSPSPALGADALRAARLLAEGLTDAAIAHREGIDERTVRRRVATVMEVLGARTRFQAGYRYRDYEIRVSPEPDQR